MKKSFMRGSGYRALRSDKARDCRFGRMDLYMKDGGRTIKPMGEAD